MAKYRMVRTEFWMNTMDVEEMTWEEMYFQLYLLTNPHTTQIGIYKITKRQIAFEMRIPIETVHSLFERFIQHYKLICYNSETKEVAIKYWGKFNLHKGGKPIMDCIYSELKEVIDTSLISYVLENIPKEDIRRVYQSFCREMSFQDINPYSDKVDDTYSHRDTIRGQKEKENKNENENKKEKQKQKAFMPRYVEEAKYDDNSHEVEDMKDIIEFWDENGFGYSNIHAKRELLSWLDHTKHLYPKDKVIEAMAIAYAKNKLYLSYVIGILKNWENEAFVTEGGRNNSRQENSYSRKESARREIGEFKLDLTAGENW